MFTKNLKRPVPSCRSASLMFCTLLAGLVALPVSADDWPQWRGPNRDEVSAETGLLKQWPEGGPEKVWTSRNAGIGYAGLAVVGDRIYTLGADETEEYLIALNVDDGSEVWKTQIGQRLTNGFGDGPRSTPTVIGDNIVCLGGRGRLVCADVGTGAVHWEVELTKLGGSIPNWGYSESPLIDGSHVVCTPGGSKGAVVCLDLKSGDVVWQASDVGDGAHYSSIISVDHFGQHQYIQLMPNRLIGLNAEDGSLLWEAEWPEGRTAVIPTPVYQNGHVYVTSGYSAGCMLVNVDRDNKAEVIYRNKDMQNHHGGVILIGGHIYGNSNSAGWMCQDLLTGEMLWYEKQKLKKGAVTFADGMLYCLDESNGDCALIEATPEGFREHGRFRLEPQTEQRSARGRIWTHPVVANGRLYLRDQEIICSYDISAK